MTNPAYRGSVIKIISIALAFWLALAGGAAAGPLVVGYSAVTSVFLPFWIGKENGFYKKEGLDTQLVYIASSTTMAQAMFARQVAISTVNSGSVVTSTLTGRRSGAHGRGHERRGVLHHDPAGDRQRSGS